MEWYVTAIAFSLFLAMRSDVNRRYKLDGLRLIFWQSLFVTVLLTPFAFMLEWPAYGTLFYPIAVITSILVMMGMTIKNNLSAQHNGRVANLEMPIKTFVLFFFWMLIDENILKYYTENPAEMAGAVSMLLIASYALNKMRKGDVGWHVFVQIVPLTLIASVGDALTKYALDFAENDPWPFIFVFIYITQLGSFALAGFIIYFRPKFAKHGEVVPKLIVPNMIKASAIIGVLTLLMLITFYHALYASPNPAYVGALGMLTPIWLLVYHKLKGIPDDANPVMGAIMVLSALGLILITA